MAIIATALSAAVMIAAVAIVGGFRREITDKVTGFNSDMVLYTAPALPEGETNIVSLTPSLKKLLESEPYILSYYPETSVPAVFKTPGDFQGVYYKGVGPGADEEFLRKNLVAGSLPDFADRSDNPCIALSRLTADRLRLKAGDTLDTYFISDDVRVRRFRVAGIFDSHFDSYDEIFAYGPDAVLADITGLDPDQGTAVRINTSLPVAELPQATARFNRRLAEAYAQDVVFKPLVADNALNLGAGYFQWLNLLDTNVAVILALMTVVAVVTLISGMLVLILDKRSLIGILKTLGASNRTVASIFVWLAMKVAVIGLLAGNALMLLFLWLQDRLHFLRLDPDAYYIDFVPVRLDAAELLLLNAAIVAVVFLSLLLPARFTAKISPAQTLRCE